MDKKISDDVCSSEEIAEVQESCKIKYQLMVNAIGKINSPKCKNELVDAMSCYFYLTDVLKASNVQAVLRMSYFRDLCPHFNSRDIIERFSVFADSFQGLSQDEILSLLVPYSPALNKILGSGKILSYEDMNFDFDAVQKNVPEMDSLAVVYVCARDNPKTCVLPDLSGVATFAAPTNIPMRLKDGSVNPEFFVEWKKAVFAKFLG